MDSDTSCQISNHFIEAIESRVDSYHERYTILMTQTNRIANWLEKRWVAPSFSGWLLSGFVAFFFIAATNTLTGWLYVLSGVGAALLLIAAILPRRNLRSLLIRREPLQPVSAGENLTVEVLIENPTPVAKTLLEIHDTSPAVLGKAASQAIEVIPPKSVYHWTYDLPTQWRGVYRWQHLKLRTAAPLGLFWCSRSLPAKATAIVYPTVLPLGHCPLIDQLGSNNSVQIWSDRYPEAANEGLTRSLRPYRWGDPTRLVHWRSSARYGELRVRELEIFSGGQELVIAIDSSGGWSFEPQREPLLSEAFEQAVIAAASLYFYALQQKMTPYLWTPETGAIQGNAVVLEALAAIQPNMGSAAIAPLPNQSVIWLTQNPATISQLSQGSRWILWPDKANISDSDLQERSPSSPLPGIMLDFETALQQQLQQPPTFLR